MFTERTGSGEDVYIAVHGWAGDHRTFQPLKPYVPQRVSLYAVDLPGWGKSPPPAYWSLDAYSDALKQFMSEVGAPDATLVGYCGGANLCLEAMSRGLAPVHRLVIIDPFADAPWYLRLFTWGEFGRRAYLSTFTTPAGRCLTNAALWRKREPGQDLTRSFAALDHEAALRFLRLLCEKRGVARFRGLVQDVDIAFGEKTFRAVKKQIPQWLNAFPGAKVHELQGASHEPLKTAARELAAIIFQPANRA